MRRKSYMRCYNSIRGSYSAGASRKPGIIKKSILAVDDDPQIRRLISRSLKDGKYEVTCVAGAEEAIQFLKKQTPHLVLLDLYLTSSAAPDGFDCLRSIRKSGYCNPIYILSSDESFERAHIAAKEGANGYFVKQAARNFKERLNTLISDSLDGRNEINRDLAPAAVAYLKTRRFTDADLRLLSAFVQGYDRQKEIARVLDHSEHAVRKKFQSIRDRLGAKSQADLARMLGVLSCFKG